MRRDARRREVTAACSLQYAMLFVVQQDVKTVDSLVRYARPAVWFRVGGDDRSGDAHAIPFRRMHLYAPPAPVARR